MTLDINLILRAWSFDLNSEVLGELRFSNSTPEEMLGIDEDATREGSISSHDLARKVFLRMAHKRTGVESIDARCGGPGFTAAEIATVPTVELDAFCNHLIKGSLHAHNAAKEKNGAPKSLTGAEGLPAALVEAIDSERAARARMAERSEEQMAIVARQHSQTAAAILRAASDTTAFSVAQDEIRRHHRLVRDAIGSIGSAASVIGNMQEHDNLGKIAAFAKEHSQTTTDILRAAGATTALGKASDEVLRQQRLMDDAMGSVGSSAKLIREMQDHSEIVNRAGGIGSAIQAMQESSRKRVGDGLPPGLLGLGELTAAQRISAAHERTTSDISSLREEHPYSSSTQAGIQQSNFRPIEMPQNPTHKTNQILGEMLQHRREAAAKSDAERAQDKVEDAAAANTNNQIARSGLFYTKLSAWVTIVAFVFPALGGIWVYWEQKEAAKVAKAGADESAKVAAVEIAELHAEIRELSAALNRASISKLATTKIAKKEPQRPK
jgi:hypothetical protein